MSDAWTQQCQQYLTKYPALKCLAITSLDGTIYGNSDATEFPLDQAFMKQVFASMKGDPASSIPLAGEKYMCLRSSPDCWLGRKEKKAIFVYPCRTIAVVGLSQDTESANNTSNGSDSVARLAELYMKSNY
ncbi:hypothetical protein T265_09050 [Opisthorchis viverrini]|uniref:Profilin n=2 Tax=Opisthorchis viverrini TaxID=6198 RepID=A0A074ZBJ4_OPIVI|nr:hypothetical protein T265_09050 [Opisthorchis viverrini]KER22967.1 hypothetical protein T265_09050 [Opisthorchis viverrini]